jgi:hypothetical protein
LFKALRNKEEFVWDKMCETTFRELKQTLAHPPVLTRSDPGKPLIAYLFVIDEDVSAVLVKEVDRVQMPVYFISKALQGPELKYQRLEKLAYALLITSWWLRPYF